MKKLWKMTLAAMLMSIAVCLCAGMTAFAETVSGEIEGCFWELDTDTGTLTLSGADLPWMTYPDFLESDSWSEYQDEIERIYLDGVQQIGVYYCLDQVKTAGGQMNQQVFWEMDCVNRTLDVTGTGEVPAAPWKAIPFTSEDARAFSHITVSDGITGFAKGFGYSTQVLEVGKDFQAEVYDGVQEAYIFSPENPHGATYEGCLYSKDFSRLLSCPSHQDNPNLHPDVKIIAKYAFHSNPIDQLILPWGVTTIEDWAFQFFVTGKITNVILPDTVTSMQQDNTGGKDCRILFTYSRSNKAVDSVVANLRDEHGTPIANPVDSLAEYYPGQATQPEPSAPAESEPSAPASSGSSDAKPVDNPSGGVSSSTSSSPSKPAESSSQPAQTASKPASSASSAPESSAAEPSSQPAESHEPSEETSSEAESSAEISSAPESDAAEISEESAGDSSLPEESDAESSQVSGTGRQGLSWIIPLVFAMGAMAAAAAVIIFVIWKRR